MSSNNSHSGGNKIGTGRGKPAWVLFVQIKEEFTHNQGFDKDAFKKIIIGMDSMSTNSIVNN